MNNISDIASNYVVKNATCCDFIYYISWIQSEYVHKNVYECLTGHMAEDNLHRQTFLLHVIIL